MYKQIIKNISFSPQQRPNPKKLLKQNKFRFQSYIMAILEQSVRK